VKSKITKNRLTAAALEANALRCRLNEKMPYQVCQRVVYNTEVTSVAEISRSAADKSVHNYDSLLNTALYGQLTFPLPITMNSFRQSNSLHILSHTAHRDVLLIILTNLAI